MTTAPPIPVPGAFAPLRQKAFLLLWVATLLGNVGIWMRDVASGWLMTSIDPRADMVALVQVVGLLPVSLFAIPAGVIADLLDRRQVLLACQALLCLVGLGLGIMTFTGHIGAWSLLGFGLAGGIVAAFSQPAWQAVVPEVLPHQDIAGGMALYNLGFNLARAIGPAIAGVLIARTDVASAYFANALLFLIVTALLLRWRRTPRPVSLPPEPFLSAVATGARYIRETPALYRVLVRSFMFFIFASAYWAVLPLVARQLLRGGPDYYGILLGCLGTGAVAGALLLPRMRAGLGTDRVVLLGTVITAATTATLALGTNQWLAAFTLLLAGAAWISVVTTLAVTAQSLLPNWVRARGIAFYLLTFYGALTAGSALWGYVARITTLQTALLITAAGGLLAGLIGLLVPLPNRARNLTPATGATDPPDLNPALLNQGPLNITIEYQVDPARLAEFVAVMREVGQMRRRNGARAWRFGVHAIKPDVHVEAFRTTNWLDYLRHQQRTTQDDDRLLLELHALVRTGISPVVTRQLAAH